VGGKGRRRLSGGGGRLVLARRSLRVEEEVRVDVGLGEDGVVGVAAEGGSGMDRGAVGIQDCTGEVAV